MRLSPYTYRQGLSDGLPIGLGYLSVSFGFGIAAVAAGLLPFEAVLISLTNLTSAGQVAGLSLIAECGGFIEMALTQLVINIRYSLMGVSLSQRTDSTFTVPKRMLLSFFITDETFAVASTKQYPVGATYFFGLVTLPFFGWTLGTLLGTLAGTLLPVMVREALGLMLFGMFIAIILPPCRREKGVLFAVSVAVGLSALLYYVPFFDFLSGGFALILSAVPASLLAAWLFPVSDDTPADPPDGSRGERKEEIPC